MSGKLRAVLDRLGPSRGDIEIAAHRGDSAQAPENTAAAFRRAIAAGARLIEFDVQLTRDGRAVVIHDDELERTTDGRGTVDRWDLADLLRLDAGSWFSEDYRGEPLIVLEEALALMRGRALPLIEIKGRRAAMPLAPGIRRAVRLGRLRRLHRREERCQTALQGLREREQVLRERREERRAERVGARANKLERRYERLEELQQELEAEPEVQAHNRRLVEAVAAAVHSQGMTRDVVVIVFGRALPGLVKSVDPELTVSLLTYTLRGAQAALAQREVDGIDPRWQAFAGHVARDFHRQGKFVTPWTINDAALLRRIAAMGPDAVITDCPVLARDVLEALELERVDAYGRIEMDTRARLERGD